MLGVAPGGKMAALG